MTKQKYLFLDRDGTLIVEPADQQIDCLTKLKLMPNVIHALHQLTKLGYRLVIISNQDGLGTPSFPMENFLPAHQFMLELFASQDIIFDAIHICPHLPVENCDCRKPKTKLLHDYLIQQVIDRDHSYVIGDRDTDLQLADNLGIKGIKLGNKYSTNWLVVLEKILHGARAATIVRKTNETQIQVDLNLNRESPISISTGICFFDHMLEQLAKHGGFSLQVKAEGDLHIDDHHTVEDTAIVIGKALTKALNNKLGINRYGFVLPMDEARATIAIDLCGRSTLQYHANLQRTEIGGLSTELIHHFFKSFAEGLKASIHVEVQGENCHHMIESMFKGLGRCLQQAIQQTNNQLPSTKGIL